MGCSPWGREESNMTGQLPFPFTFIAVSVNSIAENSNEMGFQAVAWPHCFRANREKMLILLTTSSIQVQTQYVSLQNPRIFQTDLGSLDLFYKENVRNLSVFACLFFSVSRQSFPTVTHVRGNC